MEIQQRPRSIITTTKWWSCQVREPCRFRVMNGSWIRRIRRYASTQSRKVNKTRSKRRRRRWSWPMWMMWQLVAVVIILARTITIFWTVKGQICRQISNHLCSKIRENQIVSHSNRQMGSVNRLKLMPYIRPLKFKRVLAIRKVTICCTGGLA